MIRSSTDVLREQRLLTGFQVDFLEGYQEGLLRARQQVLVDQLRGLFKRLPLATEQIIRSTNDLPRLEAWLDSVALIAKTFTEIGITSPEEP